MAEYGNVVLTLSNVSLPQEKLYPNPTPSMIEGLPWDVEYDLRLIGCELIQTACLLLQLPQTAVATGQVLFHRYFYSSTFIRRHMEIVAMACINLAAKIDENARRIRDIINVFHHIKQVRSGHVICPLLLDQAYINRKNEVIHAERRLLNELGFCVYVKHPHKIIISYLRILEKDDDEDLVQSAWNCLNDSLRTDIFLRFTPETIACACIDLAARYRQIPLPKNPPWYIIFGTQPEDVRYIMIAILRLYKHRPKPLDELEKVVNTIREKREEKRKQFRAELGNSSPAQQQTTQISISSTVMSSLTAIIVQAEVPAVVVTTTTHETTNVTLNTSGKPTQKHDPSFHESSTVKTQRQQQSRSSSRSRSPTHRSQKKKKTSHRSRSHSRSSTSKSRKHHSHASNSNRKKEKKQRSSSKDNHYSNRDNKHPLSTKDTNNNIHHSFKQINGNSSSSNKKFHSK